MSEGLSLPFESIVFTLVEDKRPRALFRMVYAGEGMYELHVEKGSAANPVSQFTRSIPLESAQRLKDALQQLGVFGWEESYGNAEGLPGRRWSLATVFKEGVFSVASKGGSAVPAGFDGMLDELYRLDFPRPTGQGTANAAGASGNLRLGGALSAGDLGAYGAAGAFEGLDPSQLGDLLGMGELPGIDSADMADLLKEAASDPQALQRRMKDEFKHMSPEEQNRMLDALASTGMASRAWWERFLRGL